MSTDPQSDSAPSPDDSRPEDGGVRHLSPDEIEGWVRDVLYSVERERPVVAVTSRPAVGRFSVEPRELASAVGRWADVVAIETGESTWALADALPERLDVYGGALRVWWPGLTPGSDPYDHRLYFVHRDEEGPRRLAEIQRDLRDRIEPEYVLPERAVRHVVGEAWSSGAAVEDAEVVVTEVLEQLLVRDAEGRTGMIRDAEYKPDALAVCLREGLTLTVSRPVDWPEERGPFPCSLRGKLVHPWRLLEQGVREGDVLRGRVVSLQERFALVELLPGATGIVGLAEVDHTFVHDIGEFLSLDEVVPVQVLSLEPERRRAQLSVKAARVATHAVRALPSLVPGGEPFQWAAFLRRIGATFTEVADPRGERIEELEEELAAANEDRSDLRRTLAELRRELRSQKDRFEDLERRAQGDLDPLLDERAFLRAVRVAYAREVGEGERFETPLAPMRVGSQFLERARALQGISVDKIVEVAAQVASGRAHAIEGREVHQLGESSAASRQRVRASDGAGAWRCSLQVKTPGARRLHWWLVPGDQGGVIEFASVAVHDDYGIPE